MIDEQKLYATINGIVDATLFQDEESKNPFGPLDDMFSVVEALQNNHIRVCVCTAMALMAVTEMAPDEIKASASKEIRRFLDGCVKDFENNLQLAMSANCREQGFTDPTDPNAKLREELMGAKYDS